MKVGDHDLKKCIPCAGGIYCPDLSIAFLKTENVKLRRALEQVALYGRVNHDRPKDYLELALAALSSDVVSVEEK